jgi:glycosyltransferase involved in cell wall biosynthesis
MRSATNNERHGGTELSAILCQPPETTEKTGVASDTRTTTFTLLIPTLNEITGMKAIMPRIDRKWVDQVLFMDGGSTDGTIEWARDNGYDVYVQKQTGIRQGFLEALPLVRGDVIITFTPDGNSVPEVIPQLVAKMKEGFDMVIASRYLPPARSDDDDLLTGFGNWFFTKTVNVLFGGGYKDVMGIYRAYKKQLIYDLELDQDRWYRVPETLFCTRSRGVSWDPMLSARAARRRLKVAEVPGDEPARLGGVRKLRIWRWGAVCYYQFWRDFFLFH